jgi:cytochrome c oxidase subunit IV
MEFHDDYPQYELMAHHGEEEGRKARKLLWTVFFVLFVITMVELGIGFMYDGIFPKPTWYLITMIVFTIGKAGGIVYYFMHLGHETKGLRYTIIAPYSLFIIYFVWIMSIEGTYNSTNHLGMDPAIMKQMESQRKGEGRPHTVPSGTHEHKDKH